MEMRKRIVHRAYRARSTTARRRTRARANAHSVPRRVSMFAMSVTHAPARAVAKPTAMRTRKSARSATIVRAEEAKATTESAAPAVWTAPKLDPNTPSPIFGGSTGGLLRKAQVRRAIDRDGRGEGEGVGATSRIGSR